MKKIITCLFTFVVMNTAFGQGHFDVGSNVIGVGIGVGGGYGSGFTYGSQTPAINLQFERGMWSIGGPGVVSLGAYVAFKTYKYDYGFSNYNSKWNYTIVGVRSAYHYNGISSDKIDIYGGLMLGMRIVTYTDNEPSFNFDYSASDVILTGYIGGRYYFSDNFGGFLELGNGLSALNIGVVYKF